MATYYVSPTGSGVAPYDTWAKAASLPSTVFANIDLEPGDIIEMDGGASGITYSHTSAIIAPGTNDSGVTIRGSMQSGHDGTVLIDGTVSTTTALSIPSTAENVTVQNVTLKGGSAHYCALIYGSGAILNDVVLDGSESSYRLMFVSGSGVSVTCNRCDFLDYCSTDYGIYVGGGAVLTLNYCKISGGTYPSVVSYVFTISGSTVKSNNCIYSDLPSGVFWAGTESSRIESTNDMFFGTNRLVLPFVKRMFECVSGATILLTNSCYLPSGRNPNPQYLFVASGTITVTNEQDYVYPKIVHHKRGGVIAVSIDSQVESFVTACAAQGDLYGIPLTFAMSRYGLVEDEDTRWADTEEGVQTKVLALTQSPHVQHEIANHTWSHTRISQSTAFFASYTGSGDGTIVVSGTYPNLTVTVNSNGSPIAAFDITDDDYGANHRDLTTIYGLRNAIHDLADWTTSEGTNAMWGTMSRGLKVASTAVTTSTAIQFDIDTNYHHWQSEITAMTTWIESFMGADYCKVFVVPFADRDGTTYTASWQAWMQANIATTHCGGARTMDNAEDTAPISTLLSDNLSHIFGIGAVATNHFVIPDSSTATEESIRQCARAFATWVAETGSIGSLAVHEAECSAEQLGYILDEFTRAQDVQTMTLGGLVQYIRTSGLWRDSGDGAWTRIYKDLSDYHLTNGSPCINAGVVVSGLTTDYAGHPVPYGLTPDIGIYEYGDGTSAGTPPTFPAAADVQSGAADYGWSDEYDPAYPTTATSQAVQLATDQAEVASKVDKIWNTTTILGQVGTLDLAAVSEISAAVDASQTASDVAAIQTRVNALESDVDGVSCQTLRELMLASAAGKVAITDNGDGTSTAVFKKQDGSTTILTVTYSNTSGARSATATIGT